MHDTYNYCTDLNPPQENGTPNPYIRTQRCQITCLIKASMILHRYENW